MKFLLLTLSIVGFTYGASILKEENLKDHSPILSIKESLLSLGLSRILGGNSLDKDGTINDAQQIESYNGYEDDLDWRCIWEKREALEKCSKKDKEMSDIEQSICLLKEAIDCFRYYVQ
ncbi:hypothetical protein MSG28_013664 [Choristoneura fumiferana]|uniref:Uncharacterized protein n=1 Tax=Choristoneura fumiferana TaxID=7141 RepID=A0ACC0K875_CHOFU|nr:hypothetical protein MSG28_013664 [Choristoneura fumiferana]